MTTDDRESSSPTPEEEQLSPLEQLTSEIRLADNPITASEILQQALNEHSLEGALLMASTAQHLIGNKIALTQGHVALFLANPKLPQDFKEDLQIILESTASAGQFLTRMGNVTSLPLSTAQNGPAFIDLDQATQEPNSPAADTNSEEDLTSEHTEPF